MDVLHYSNDIVELIADDGVTITGEHVRELFALLDRLEPKVQGVLANRLHRYSFSFEAQRELSNYQGLKAVAILTYSRIAYIAAKLHRAKYFKLRTFRDREEALQWLDYVIAQRP